MTLAHRVAILEKGVLQQLDTPAKIYNDPANLFVAQFIGSPPMNVVHGSLEGTSFKSSGTDIGVAVSGQISKAILGFRPEDCGVVAPGKGNIRGRIYTTELIGDHTLVTVETDQDKLTVKAPKDFSGQQGDAIGVSLSKDHLFIFDAQSGQRIR
jgi:multiple sugar transport system ATP-binding protein